MTINNIEFNTFYKKAIDYICSYFKKKTQGKELLDFYPLNISSYNCLNVETNNVSETISNLYETIIPLGLKKDFGVFYTNNTQVIDYMLNEVDILSGKILEPSCGSGLFITQIVNKLNLALKNKNLSCFQRLQYIQQNVIANDIDINACKLTELNFLSTLMEDIIWCANNEKDFKLSKFLIYNLDFTNKNNLFKDINIVIGNPPYVTLYGKRSRNMNEEKRCIYNQFNFVQNKNGNNKFNISMFFIENGLLSLKTNGNLVFILDISFFETAFIDLRKYILEKYNIISITSNLKEFSNVASGQIIINVKKACDLHNFIQWTVYDSQEKYKIEQVSWLMDKPKYRFLLPLGNEQKQIISKCETFLKLSEIFPNKSLRTCCALTGKTNEFVVDKNQILDSNLLKFEYLEGSKGVPSKFCHPNPTLTIKYDYNLQLKISDKFKEELEKIGVKNKKRVTLGDKEAYLAPKIFIRQSAFELIATYTEEPYAANNSIYILTNKDYSSYGKKLLKYVCGLINSNLLSYYARVKKIIRYEKGKTPQIKISDLKELPLDINNDLFNEIINIVDLLLHDPSNKKAITQLNKHVYQIYGINANEVEIIENYLKTK